jgi:pimeloyl-[acyl-carrier protein] methyl ester esterase
MSQPLQIIAMHGWCGDSHSWDPWLPAWQAEGWSWSLGERGYGNLPPRRPLWSGQGGLRVVMAHSLGPHLLASEVLAEAQALVLLTSFGRFVPNGRAGRAVRTALEGMAAQLQGPEPRAMLQGFLAQVAAPQSPELLQSTPAGAPLPAAGVERLREDLALIAATTGLPQGCGGQTRALLLQAGADQIVVPEARQALEQELPQADVIRLAGAGHGLLCTPTVPLVMAWLRELARP